MKLEKRNKNNVGFVSFLLCIESYHVISKEIISFLCNFIFNGILTT